MTHNQPFSKTLEVYSSTPIKIKTENGNIYSFLTADITNEAVLSKERKTDCVRKQGAFFFYYNQHSYQVNRFSDDALQDIYEYILNLKAVLSNGSSLPVTGTFVLDAGKSTPELFQNLCTYIHACSPTTQISELKNATANPLTQLQQSEDKQMLLVGTALLTLLLMLNIASLNRNWLAHKRKELFVRYLVGAEKSRLLSAVAKDYSSAFLCSLAVGCHHIQPFLPSLSISIFFGVPHLTGMCLVHRIGFGRHQPYQYYDTRAQDDSANIE